MHFRRLFRNALCALLGVCGRFAAAQDSCVEIKNLKLEHAAVVSAKWVEAGTMQPPPEAFPGARKLRVGPHCEVIGVSRPTSDSEITFMLLLPPEKDWNGKYLQLGNGGWAGNIQPAMLIEPLAHGYAVSATDDGHKTEDPRKISADWATGHPEKLIDFGYRALHETANLSKVIVKSFYGKGSAQAYFFGCSDGGREALMEAERYPEDFNGIIAGAPANHWTNHLTGFVWDEIAMEAEPSGRIKADQLPTIEKAALAACDSLDGVKDGLIEDPRKCHFDPSVLLCRGSAQADCLSQSQINTLSKIYAGPKDPVTGEQIYPGYEPGTEAEPGSWVPWIIAPSPIPMSLQFSFGNSFYSGAVFENPSWDWKTMDFHRDLRIANDKTESILNSWNPDLRTFRDHGES